VLALLTTATSARLAPLTAALQNCVTPGLGRVGCPVEEKKKIEDDDEEDEQCRLR
jgi:hypothetical protein